MHPCVCVCVCRGVWGSCVIGLGSTALLMRPSNWIHVFRKVTVLLLDYSFWLPSINPLRRFCCFAWRWRKICVGLISTWRSSGRVGVTRLSAEHPSVQRKPQIASTRAENQKDMAPLLWSMVAVGENQSFILWDWHLRETDQCGAVWSKCRWLAQVSNLPQDKSDRQKDITM